MIFTWMPSDCLSMAYISLYFISFFVLFGIVQGRILRLNSSDNDLTSDGVDHFEHQISYITADITQNTCNHQYGFLPCAENEAGFIFQILVYQGLLIYGEKQIGSGSKAFFNIIGVGKIGGIIFRILMSLPSMMLMIVSGIFSNKESAQSLVSIGVGIYAGITVFSLTIQWGICVLSGGRDFPQRRNNRVDSKSNCLPAREIISVLKDTGVEPNSEAQEVAGIMLLSLIPYIIVQLDKIFSTSSGSRILILIALIVSSLLLIAYFVYQIAYPWIQIKSYEYAQFEILRNGFLKHVQKQGKLVNEKGELNIQFIKELFYNVDKDGNHSVTKVEMEKMLVEIIRNGKLKVDEKFAVEKMMQTFDQNDDMNITLNEFVDGCKKLIDGTSNQAESSSSSQSISRELFNLFKHKKENDPQERERVMSKLLLHAETELLKAQCLITTDGKPNIDHIKTLFNQFDSDGNKMISTDELKNLLKTVNFGESQIKYEDVVTDLFKAFDKDENGILDEGEFVDAFKTYVDKAIHVTKTLDSTGSRIEKYHTIMWAEKYRVWELIASIIQILFGVVILTFLGGPLMTSILQLSYTMNLPSFSISFVIVPLAMNIRAAIAAILPASHKTEQTDSLTFIEIYGGVIMNNISGMTALLAIVYAKDLTWDFSAEVLTVLVVCAIVGSLAYTRKTYPTWTCILTLFLYPFSLGLFYAAQRILDWN